MAGTVYKQRKKQDRRAVLETLFDKGMMSSNGVIEEGYLKSLVNFIFEKENKTLVPRPGIGLADLILPDVLFAGTQDFFNTNVGIKASKECVENGTFYSQVLFGKLDSNSNTKGSLWVSTSEKESDPAEIKFDSDFTDSVAFSKSNMYSSAHTCYYYSTGNASIHKVPLYEDEYKRIEMPVGSFAFGNSYYFFGEDGEGNPGLFRTKFDEFLNKYAFEGVTPKECSVSEAVTYGYNSLLGDNTYVFENKHTSALIQFEGILPYEPGTNKLMMAPKQNQPVDLVCYYNAPLNGRYRIVWEWREASASDWTVIEEEYSAYMTQFKELKISQFRPPANNIMVRVSAYPYKTIGGEDSTTPSDTVEQAMVVGLNFGAETYGEANILEQKIYDLTTATGMTSWNGRLVVWGLPADPTILFISDYNDPSYFPYPNNITVFDSPIIYAVEFMGSLVVFTTEKLYQVSLSDDGTSWNSTVLQSHLYLNSWDRHLIQTVRNMLYFKSGNYYYMMVPKAQSTTGELTLAPITTPITSFFDNFSVNVQDILKNTYGYTDTYSLLTYHNFLDYEDIHNLYVYSFDDTAEVLYFDVIYNTVDRTWKVWVYEASNLLFPYKQDATQMGLLATTSLVNITNATDPTDTSQKRIIQIYKWNKGSVAEYYIPGSTVLHFYEDTIYPTVSDGVLHLSGGLGLIEPPVWHINGSVGFVDEPILHLTGMNSFFAGFNKLEVHKALINVYRNQEDHFTFRNYQFIDTGYRRDEFQAKKRYREIQLQVNNLDKKNLNFGMEYLLDGAAHKMLYKYETEQLIDELDPDYATLYVNTVPYMEVDLDNIDLTNQWTLDQNLAPDISLWKIRVAISGKGSAPRLKLYSRNGKRFELLSINWISKVMNMR